MENKMSQPRIVDELKTLFRPRSVAVIGASNNITKWGYSTFSSLMNHFEGDLYAVNNRDATVVGRPGYAKVSDIPGPVDLAVIVVPAERVADVMEDCVEKGIKAGVIISAGFAEVGAKGKALQDEVVRIAEKGRIRLVGPNCMGMWSAPSKLTAFMFPMRIEKGPLALVSQGGNIGGAIVADATARGIGFQQYISCGCTADIQIEDYIEYAGHDDSVKAILVYIEGLNDGARFVEKVRAVTRRKPVIVVKPGKTDAAKQAISSHSGSMSGQDSIYEAAFAKSGVIRVDTTIELLDVAIALLYQPLPKGRNVIVATPGGSYGVMCADACALQGLNLIDLPPKVLAKFNTMFPSRWSHGNPVDPAGDRDFIQYLRAPEILLASPEVDALIFMGFGSFSGVSSVFASGRGHWSLDDLTKKISGVGELANAAIAILDSGEPDQIKDLFKSILNLTLGSIMATTPKDMGEFSELISTALTSEEMLQRSFIPKTRDLFELVASGDTASITMEDIVELMEPMIEAMHEQWTRQFGKPVITTTFTEGTSRISEGGHFPYPNSERAATVLAKMVEYQEYLDGD